ncbi:hypothetical protein B0A55_11288 [Friedmanniomyces simplex]|uniref:Uncharacterized protein n=1 Tax=Friedmanniomyces simplex TaxID=329884 RepID=A0A4U0W3M8_9PEZI|nr:hypothetical protein B0A55_11288 [Friedmanniomyces simplex]
MEDNRALAAAENDDPDELARADKAAVAMMEKMRIEGELPYSDLSEVFDVFRIG